MPRSKRAIAIATNLVLLNGVILFLELASRSIEVWAHVAVSVLGAGLFHGACLAVRRWRVPLNLACAAIPFVLVLVWYVYANAGNTPPLGTRGPGVVDFLLMLVNPATLVVTVPLFLMNRLLLRWVLR